jgi:hypothetical protein
MPKNDKVPLTTVVDFVSKAGTPKLTVVKGFKNRPAYDPATDFYKALREEIARMHQKNAPKKSLDQFVGTAYPKKQGHYAAVVAGYKKFLGSKAISWFQPPSKTWAAGGLTVAVNPELGLEIGGVKHAIKLYFKGEKLALNKVEVINHLMNLTLSDPKDPVVCGVLDTRNATLFTNDPGPALTPLLAGEAAAFAAMLASL